MESQEERNAEKLMDSYLKSIGFQRKKVAKDGSCLFRAVAEQVSGAKSPGLGLEVGEEQPG